MKKLEPAPGGTVHTGHQLTDQTSQIIDSRETESIQNVEKNNTKLNKWLGNKNHSVPELGQFGVSVVVVL